MTIETARPSQRSASRKLPILVAVLAVVGGVAGALLAEPGDFWGSTVPSTLTFLAAGLIIGLVIWGVAALIQRSRA